jgi:hypothetical protein
MIRDWIPLPNPEEIWRPGMPFYDRDMAAISGWPQPLMFRIWISSRHHYVTPEVAVYLRSLMLGSIWRSFTVTLITITPNVPIPNIYYSSRLTVYNTYNVIRNNQIHHGIAMITMTANTITTINTINNKSSIAPSFKFKNKEPELFS